MEAMENSKMENTKDGGAANWNTLLAMAALKPKRTFALGVAAFSFYFGLFAGTGALLASLAGWPVWPTVGLVFLLRLCFT